MSLIVINPRNTPCWSTTGSFSMRWAPRIRSASSRVVPTAAVTRSSLVIASRIGRSSWRSNCRSRLVMMPTSFPAESTIGTPEIRKRAMSWDASRSGRSGPSVIGFRIMPDSLRFTRSTSAAWRSIGMFLWITPMPPARAMAIAISASVTVSIAADTSGMLSGMSRVKRLAMSTLRGCTVACRGTRRTSSKVRAGSWRKVPIAEVTAGPGCSSTGALSEAVQHLLRERFRPLPEILPAAEIADRQGDDIRVRHHHQISPGPPGREPEGAVAEAGDRLGALLRGEKVVLRRVAAGDPIADRRRVERIARHGLDGAQLRTGLRAAVARRLGEHDGRLGLGDVRTATDRRGRRYAGRGGGGPARRGLLATVPAAGAARDD